MPQVTDCVERDNIHFVNRASVLYLIIVLCLTWTQLIGVSAFFAKSWFFILLGILSIFVINPEFYGRLRLIIPILLYGTIVFLNYLFGDSYFNEFPAVCLEIGVLIVSSSIVFYCFTSNDLKFIKCLFIIFNFIVVYSTVATFFLESQTPGVVRDATREAYEGSLSRLWYYYKFGMTSYELPHALPILIPPIVIGIKKGNTVRYKLCMIFLLLAVFLLIYFSGAATPLLFGFVMLVLSFFLSPTNNKRNIIYIVVTSVFFFYLFNEAIILQLLDILNNGILGQNVFFREKIIEFERMVLLGDSDGSDISSRMSLYDQTLSALKGNVLFGNNSDLGGHSALLDRLSSLGMIGFIPYVLILMYHFRFFHRRISKDIRLYYVLGFLYGIVLLLTKSMSNWNTFLLLFVLLPMSMYLLKPFKQEEENADNCEDTSVINTN